jgi:hypothetical protein
MSTVWSTEFLEEDTRRRTRGNARRGGTHFRLQTLKLWVWRQKVDLGPAEKHACVQFKVHYRLVAAREVSGRQATNNSRVYLVDSP